MANPSFDNVDLVDHAAAEAFRSPEARTTRECLPDVAGEFFQVHPAAGREIVVRGVLSSSVQVSAAFAEADLKAKVRARQGKVGAVATYRGTDDHEYTDSLLWSFQQLDFVQVCSTGAGVQALVHVEARIVAQP